MGYSAPSLKIGHPMTAPAQKPGLHPRNKNAGGYDFAALTAVAPGLVKYVAEEIARRTAADEADGFYLNMKYFFLGRRIRHCGYAEAWNLRLFKHRLGRYERMPVPPGAKTGDNEAHEHVELRGRALRLEHELDHHAYPTRRYQVLRHFDDVPQLPTGYAGMITLAVIPPLWRRVMDHRVVEFYDGDVTRANIHPRVREKVVARWATAPDAAVA